MNASSTWNVGSVSVPKNASSTWNVGSVSIPKNASSTQNATSTLKASSWLKASTTNKPNSISSYTMSSTSIRAIAGEMGHHLIKMQKKNMKKE
jgi:hypothetical protein